MGKKAKKGMKLPKQLLGVKLPKKSRKSLNRMLKSVSSDEVSPLVAATVSSVVTLLAERLERPLEALLNPATERDRRRPPASAAAH